MRTFGEGQQEWGGRKERMMGAQIGPQYFICMYKNRILKPIKNC
jgi:hypothetical protein